MQQVELDVVGSHAPQLLFEAVGHVCLRLDEPGGHLGGKVHLGTAAFLEGFADERFAPAAVIRICRIDLVDSSVDAGPKYSDGLLFVDDRRVSTNSGQSRRAKSERRRLPVEPSE
jgi:hypothetical protein